MKYIKVLIWDEWEAQGQRKEWRTEQREMQKHMQTMVEMVRNSGEMGKVKPQARLTVKLGSASLKL